MDPGSSNTTGAVSDHISPTLNDIISRHDLKEEHLQKECSQKSRLKIAKRLKDWEMLGHYLTLSEENLTAIKRENDTEALRKLASALYQHDRKDLVELLCQAVKIMVNSVSQSKNEAMFRTNEEKIRAKFAILLRRVRLALEENKVTTEDVCTILVGMFGEDCIPKSNSLEEIISAVTKKGLWNYMHHSPVEELLHNLIPHHKSLIRQYKEHLSGYEATTTLIDYIKYTKVDSRDGSNEIPLGDYNKSHYQQLRVKLDIERNITLLSLKYVQDLWEQFAEEFHIPFLTALINKIDRGCIEITWLVSSDVAKKIAKSANKSIHFFKENDIVCVALDDNPIYDQLEVCTHYHTL